MHHVVPRTQPRDDSPGPPPTGMRMGAALLFLGGVLVTAAAWLDLGTARGEGYRETLRAADTFEGGAFLAAGVGLVIAGVAAWGPSADRRLRIIGLGSALGAGAVLWLALAAALTVGRQGGRLGEGVDVALAPGLYLALVGGALALAGGAVALLAPGTSTRTPTRREVWEAWRPGDPGWSGSTAPEGTPPVEEEPEPPPTPEVVTDPDPPAWRTEPRPGPRERSWERQPPADEEPTGG